MTADEIRESYRRLMDEAGETVLIRRYTGAGANRPYYEAAVTARVREYNPQELVGTIKQGDRKLIVLAEDLTEAQFALPVRVNDKAVVRGKELNIEAADDNSRRFGGEIIAVEIQARG